MDRRVFVAATGSCLGLSSSARGWTWSWRGAILDRAIPAVGSTGNRSPREIRLAFDRPVIAAFSRVRIENAGGTAFPSSPPVNDGADSQIILVRPRRTLPPDTYFVRWYVVSVDRHQATGAFHFSVS